MRNVITGIALVTAVSLCLLPLSMAAGGIGAQAEIEKGKGCHAEQQLQISISGGLGLTVTVTNIGDSPIKNLSWTISLSGLIFGGVDQASGHVPFLEPGESFTALLLVLGLGPASLLVEVNDATAAADVWLVGPFVFGI